RRNTANGPAVAPPFSKPADIRGLALPNRFASVSLSLNAGCQRTPCRQSPSPDYSNPSPQGSRPGAPARLSRNSGRDPRRSHTAPLTPPGENTATGCPTGQPEGWGTGIGRGARRHSHTRRYQSRCGQLISPTLNSRELAPRATTAIAVALIS